MTILDSAWAVKSGGSDTAIRPLWQGLQLDDVSGLYHARNHEVSATLGRPLQRDPIGFAAGDVNVYRWLGNGPIGAVDPLVLEPYWSKPGEAGFNERVANIARRLIVNGKRVTVVVLMSLRPDHPGLPDAYKIDVTLEGGGRGEVRITPRGDVITDQQWADFFDRDPKQARRDKRNRDMGRRKGSITCDGLAGIGVTAITTGGVFYIVESAYGVCMDVGETGGMAKANEVSLAKVLQLTFAQGYLAKGQTYTFDWRGETYKTWTAPAPASNGTGETHFLIILKFGADGMETIVPMGRYPIVSTDLK